jgi:hypothetical protein
MSTMDVEQPSTSTATSTSIPTTTQTQPSTTPSTTTTTTIGHAHSLSGTESIEHLPATEGHLNSLLDHMFAQCNEYIRAEIMSSVEDYECLTKLNQHAGKKVCPTPLPLHVHYCFYMCIDFI